MDRCLGEDSGGLLEGGRREPRLGCQRSLGDTHELRTSSCRRTASRHNATVSGFEQTTLNKFTRQELSVATLNDGDALEHLTNDDLDVLVVDRYTL